MLETIHRLLRTHRQFVLYCIIGASGALLDLIVFLILFNVIHMDALVATTISTSLGIINNFFLNARFNFKVKDRMRVRLLNFYAVGITGLLLSLVIIFAAHNGLGVDANIAKIISIPLIVLAQFFLNKKISFGNSPLGSKTTRRQLFILAGIIALYALFMWNATFLAFQDEIDNILGGWLISHHGQVLYADFFSHHMPLPYFISAFITLFTGSDVDWFRYVFTTGLFVWLIFILKKFYQHTSLVYTAIFAVLITIVHCGALAHLMLAETLIAFACLHATLLFVFDFFGKRTPVTLQTVVLISALGFIPVMSSASYLTLSVLIYVIFAVYYIFYQRLLTRKRLALVARDIAIIALPYALFAAYLVVTHTAGEFIQDAYKFNTDYYSQFTTSAAADVSTAYLNQFYAVITSMTQALFITQPSLTLLGTIAFFLACMAVAISVVDRKYMIALWFSAIIYISATRGGISIDPYTEGTKRAQVYVFIICLLSVYVLMWAIKQNQKRKASDLQRGLTIVAFTLASATIILHGVSGLYYNTGITQIGTQGVQTDISTPQGGGEIAKIINTTTDPGESYWLGPWDFYTQLYVERERASRYTFFLPWHSVCIGCYDELLKSFDAEKPTVIYWKHGTDMIGKDVDSYNKLLFMYLEKHYYRTSDPALKDYYFLQEKKTRIDQRLQSLQYKP